MASAYAYAALIAFFILLIGAFFIAIVLAVVTTVGGEMDRRRAHRMKVMLPEDHEMIRRAPL